MELQGIRQIGKQFVIPQCSGKKRNMLWNYRELGKQEGNTNRNIKRSVYCQYGQYSLTFRALALRQRETENKWANARNVRPYYPYWQYTDLFIFRFVSLLCLRSTLRLFQNREIVCNTIVSMPTSCKTHNNMKFLCFMFFQCKCRFAWSVHKTNHDFDLLTIIVSGIMYQTLQGNILKIIIGIHSRCQQIDNCF